MAERIVDRLEAVEVEEEHRAAMLAPHRADQSVVERPAQRFAVGEAGQRILAREPVELDLRLAHLGQVGCKAAKAEEAADIVVNRTARDRPPDLVLGLGPDDEVLKGDVRRQIEAEGALRRRLPSAVSVEMRSVNGRSSRSAGSRPSASRRCR